ncbi:hypothetical protein ACFQFH_20015 [Halobaculum halobium]|uniref:Uncharacterized protein n=1 Tax=Halobaculum halobium TaxID=3032281 RepID=A0ABD5TFY3_9EURY|nr:hypothetical protein [Halobaculum sp. SYNS20]
MGVQTLHEKQNGTQRTYHVVSVEDATGKTFPHTFEDTADGIEYRGAGEPGEIDERDDAPASAVSTLEAYTGEELGDD